jgi:hypothetical protein
MRGKARLVLQASQPGKGKMPGNAKPFKAMAPSVFQIVSEFKGDTFRTVRWSARASLHFAVLRKKSKLSRGPPQPEISPARVRSRT